MTAAATLEKQRTGSPIQFVDLQRQYLDLKTEMDAAVAGVMFRADFILGSEVTAFEEAFASYCGAAHCVGVGSGLDALTLTLRGLGIGPGHEVILPGNTFVATALAVSHAGATPVLVDHDADTYNIDPAEAARAVNERTRAIIPVHLYGQPADMDALTAIADEHGLTVIEDAAQAHGAAYRGRRCGALGRAAAFSFYPGKNLGGCGDGGAIVTDDAELAEWLRKARNYGSVVKYKHESTGFNTRLDAIQAAVLRVKLRHLDNWNCIRTRIAETYDRDLADLPIVRPVTGAGCTHIYHLYVIRCGSRDALLAHLKERGVTAGIHYPVPIHHQPAYQRRCLAPRPLTNTERFANQLLSLPIHPHMTPADVARVTECLHEFPGDLTPG